MSDIHPGDGTTHVIAMIIRSWGEFSIPVTVVFKDKSVPPVEFDYNLEFMAPSYTMKQVLVSERAHILRGFRRTWSVQAIKNPSPALLRLLEQDEQRRKSSKLGLSSDATRKSRPRGPPLTMENGQIDLDTLASRLTKLTPTHALTIAQLIKKSAPSELRVTESPGAFEFDLSECPDALVAEIVRVVKGMDE